MFSYFNSRLSAASSNFATIRPRRGPGTFYSTTETRTEKTVEALKLVFDEIEKLRSADAPDQELQDAKSFMIGSFPLNIEVPNDLATRLDTIFLYDLGDDYLQTYRDNLLADPPNQSLRDNFLERYAHDNPCTL